MMRRMPPYVVPLAGGLAGAALAYLTADWATRAWGVSDMEGGRAMLILFFFTPLGLLFGAAVGHRAAPAEAADAGTLLRRIVAAVAVTGTTIGVVGAVPVGVRRLPDTAPLTNGPRWLDVELRFTSAHTDTDALRAHGMTASVHASQRTRRPLGLRFEERTEVDAFVLIPGSAEVRRRFAAPSVSVAGAALLWYQAALRIDADPGPAGTDWSEWEAAVYDAGPDGNGDAGFAVRWRLRPAGS